MNKMIINARFLTQRITGVQRYAIEISKKLKTLEPRLRLVCPQNILHPDLAQALDVEPIGKLKGHLWEQIELPIFLRNNGTPVLLNLANTGPALYPRNFLTLHDLSPLRNPQWFSFTYRTCYRFLTPIIARKARYIFTDSTFSKSEIISLLQIPENRIGIIPCAVSDTLLPLTDQPTTNPYGQYILAVSSLDPRKNFSRLLEAFSRLSSLSCKLVLVGGENRIFGDSRLGKEARRAGNVIFTGYLEDSKLVSLYQHARCLVYPSLYEGFGMPPLEAMACGCPVIVSNAAPLPETCGPAAVYCDPYDPTDMAIKIKEVVENEPLRNSLREKGFKQVRQFSWEQSARKIHDILTRAS
jgi:glycosyltransferase involved in cell wall biosynthesis